jgi:NAD(P)-dependent dehydrogenase (short-subunit alcohol dehydrogenase family)
MFPHLKHLPNTWQKNWGAKGITANVVAPGPVETGFNSSAIRSKPQMKGFLSSLSLLGGVGNADDIGSVVAFLCTDDANGSTGSILK